MEVGDDMATLVPDKARTRPPWNLIDIERVPIPAQRHRSDVGHRRRDPLEQLDIGLFVGGEIAPGLNGPALLV